MPGQMIYDEAAVLSSIWNPLLFLDHTEFLQGIVFVDRDGKYFRHILNWLRDGIIPTLTDSEYQELLREAEYYQLIVSHTLKNLELLVSLVTGIIIVEI